MANLLIQEDQIDLKPNSSVVEVTFFLNRARVKRQLKTEVVKGENTLVFENLASRIDENSIKIEIIDNSAGSIKPVSTTLKQNRLYFFKKEEHRKVQTNIITCLKKVLKLLDEKTLYALEQKLIDELSEYIQAALNEVILEGDTPMSKLGEALEYLHTLSDSNVKELIDISSSINKLDEEYKVLKERLDRAEQLDSAVQNGIEVIFTSDARAEVVVEAAYTVKQASWSPSYDADLDPVTGLLNLNYFGELYQNTGEDWKDAKIFLSTVPSDIPLDIPLLDPVYLSGYEEKRTKEIHVEAESVPELLGEEAAQEEQEESEPEGETGAAPLEAGAEVPGESREKKDLMGITFCIDKCASLLSGTSGYKVLITGENLQSAAYYECIPEIMEHVYLKAVLTNSTKYLFLPGMVRVLRGGTYMGQVKMDYVSCGQEFALSFGIDEDLRIRRRVSKNIYTEAKGLGRKQKLERRIDFVLNNYKKTVHKITLKEAVFVSEIDEISVSLLPETSPGLEPDKEGIASIELEVPADPFAALEVVLAYKVEAPRDFDLPAITGD